MLIIEPPQSAGPTGWAVGRTVTCTDCGMVAVIGSDDEARGTYDTRAINPAFGIACPVEGCSGYAIALRGPLGDVGYDNCPGFR